MNKVLLVLIFIFSSSTFASETALCICQTGEKGVRFVPDSLAGVEKFFFKEGCDVWLNNQMNCNSKKVLSINDNLLDYIPEDSNEKVLKLGFVGHFIGAYYMNERVTKELPEIIREKDMSIQLDDTSCSLMDYRGSVTGIDSIDIPKNRELVVKGNQVISIGTWSDIIPGFEHANPHMTISSKTGEFVFPQCRDFIGKRCLGVVQGNEYAECNDNNEHEKIRCCEKTFSSTWEKSRDC